jgi:uncharacterized membrane protein YkvA (DUF1232 family)
MAPSPRTVAFTAAAAQSVVDDGPTGFLRRLGSIPAMLRDTLTGAFPGLSRGKLALMALATVYIVSPIDFLPEALLTIPGLADDAVVAVWLAATLFTATDHYRAWRDESLANNRTVPGAVIS